MNAIVEKPLAGDRLVPASDAPMVQMIERIAMDPAIPLERLEKMLEMKEKMDRQAAERAFASAFAVASSQFPSIALNGRGNNSKPYALLKDIIGGTRPVLSDHGLVLAFDVQTTEKTVTITAILSHKDGHSRSTSITLPTDNSGSKNVVQAFGSTQTYGQRYTAQALLGLSLGDDTDDDAASTKSATIDPEELDEIEAALTKLKLPISVILQAEKIAALHYLPADKFAVVMGKLRVTAKERGVTL